MRLVANSAFVIVWCGMANFIDIGPYFFEDRRAVTVHYVEMLQNFLTPELSCHGTELSTIWFKQDGATAHTARASMQDIQKTFPDHVMSLRSDHPRPAHSLDLSACVYFLWRYLKAKVHTTTPQTTDEIKIAIWKQISVIPENMARRAVANL
jgi:hypothetical protein